MPRRSVSIAAAVTIAVSAVPSRAADPALEPDGSFIQVTGTIASVHAGGFELDFGDGRIRVEMDDFDAYDEASALRPGERVIVYGRVDDGLYEARTLEADSLYAFSRNAYYYADDTDEERDAFSRFGAPPAAAPQDPWVHVSGRVKRVEGREIVLDTGVVALHVDTRGMTYDPTDAEGLQRIEAGDRIAVTGAMSRRFFDDKRIDAVSIVSLAPARRERAAPDVSVAPPTR